MQYVSVCSLRTLDSLRTGVIFKRAVTNPQHLLTNLKQTKVAQLNELIQLRHITCDIATSDVAVIPKSQSC